MHDRRPVALASYIETACNTNDTLIVDAFIKLEDAKTRGKMKATVATIIKLTGLSRNTIRNRQWALERLKAIKKKLKTGIVEEIEGESAVDDEVAIQSSLRERIKTLLDQNVLLYEEILSLHRIIDVKDIEITELSIRKLKNV